MSALDTYKQSEEAFNSHNADAVAALYAAEVVVSDPMYPEPLRGREAVRQDYADFVRSFPDLRVTVSKILVSGDTVAFEIQVSGTHQGPIITPTGTIPATNRPAELRIGVFTAVDTSGIILDERRYYDVAGLAQQLGLST